MRKIFYILGIKVASLFLLMLMHQPSLAQDGAESCADTLGEWMAAVRDACSEAENGQACNLSGELTALDTLTSLQSNPISLTDADSAQWLRIPTEAGTLDVVLYGDSRVDGRDAWRNLNFSSAETSPCAAGLLLDYQAEEAIMVELNSRIIQMQESSLMLQGDAEAFWLYVLRGSVEVVIDNDTIILEQGAYAHIRSDELETGARFPFALWPTFPYGLLSESAPACVAGVTSEAESVVGYRLPASDATLVRLLSVNAHYPVLGYAERDGVMWWQIQDEFERMWVQADDVQHYGDCEALDLIRLDSQNDSDIPASLPGVNVPAGTSIWQAVATEDNPTGDCNAAPIVTCDHLVAITLNEDGSIEWRGQEPMPYTLIQSEGNSYSYEGSSHLGNSTLALNVTFEREDLWTMTWSQVFNDDPDCVHQFSYEANFLR